MASSGDALLVGHVPPNSALDLAVALHETVPDVSVLLATDSADEIGGRRDLRGRAPPLILCRDRLGFGALAAVRESSAGDYGRNAIPDY
jgi:hypothetical protein